MSFVYHMVPSDMRGDTLLPLNRIRDTWPDVYARAVRKYAGREEILESRVPLLNCLWNDVIHFSPVPPHILVKTLKEAGNTTPLERSWFKIPLSRLDGLPAVELETGPHAPRGTGPYEFLEAAARPFSASGFQPLNEIPSWTRQYYAGQYDKGLRPLLFHGVVHVLVQGAVDVSGVEIIQPNALAD